MASTSEPDELKQVIIVRADLAMGKGKLAAQAAHASLDSFLDAQRKSPDEVQRWLNKGMPKVAIKVQGERELLLIFGQAKEMNLPCSLISDAGRTQIEPGTKTCVGIGPAKSEYIDRISGKLPLL